MGFKMPEEGIKTKILFGCYVLALFLTAGSMIFAYKSFEGYPQFVYFSSWFSFGILACLSGMTSTYMSMTDEKSSEEDLIRAANWMRHHYLLCWLTSIVGYPILVSHTFYNFYRSDYAHLLTALSLLPLCCYFKKYQNRLMSVTQLISGILILSHVYITFLTSNWYTLSSSLLMISNIVSLSVPTKVSFYGITARESFILGMGACSGLFALGMSNGAKCSCTGATPPLLSYKTQFKVV